MPLHTATKAGLMSVRCVSGCWCTLHVCRLSLQLMLLLPAS